MKYKVANLTFDGVDSPLFHMGDIDGNVGSIIDSRFPYGKFGWFYGVMLAITIFHSSCFPSEKRLRGRQVLDVFPDRRDHRVEWES